MGWLYPPLLTKLHCGGHMRLRRVFSPIFQLNVWVIMFPRTPPPPLCITVILSPQRGELICLYGVCANFVVKHWGRPDVLTTIVVTYDMCICMYRTYAVLRSPHMVYVCDRVVAKSDVLDNYRCQIRFFIFVHFKQFRCCLPFSSQVVATEFQLIYRVVFKVAQLISPVCFNFVVSHN